MTNDTSMSHRRPYSAAKILLLALLFLALAACAPRAPQNDMQTSVPRYTVRNAFSPVTDTSDLFRISETAPAMNLDGGDVELNEERFVEPSAPDSLELVQPTKGTRLGSPFGLRYHPIKHRRILHSGVDISGRRGEKVVASAAGKVLFSGRNGAYGLMIDIEVRDGVVLRYAHLDKLAVKKGAIVKQGQYIGNLGRTGRVTAPHLHFEVRLNGRPVNPMKYLDPNHAWANNSRTNP